MAMTSLYAYGSKNRTSELFFFQLLKQTASSTWTVPNLQDIWYLQPHLCEEKPSPPLTTREQLMLISSFFGFSKSKLGEIFGVSRQSIYNWFDNANIDTQHYEKISRLAEVAYEVDPKPSQNIFHIYINNIIEGYEKSLFDYILENDFDKNTVVKLSKKIYEMSKERWKRIDVIHAKTKYGQDDPSILEYNLMFFEEEKLGLKKK